MENRMKQKIRLFVEGKDEGIHTILRTEIGAHPDNVSYLREQYEDPSEFDEFYEAEDFETTYLSNGKWFQTDLLTNISYLDNRKEVDWDEVEEVLEELSE
jgi:hypothetical protein|tara:strand:+ start:172 stop:471 length:300 start_codon:yes stop_codon:yes gene_type:complete